MAEKLPAYFNPATLPEFQALVRRAVRYQRRSITPQQFNKILSVFLAKQEQSAPLMGWFYANRELLRGVLLDWGVSVRFEKRSRPNRYMEGFARLVKIEKRIHQQQKRKQK